VPRKINFIVTLLLYKITNCITRNFDTCNKKAKAQSCIVGVVIRLRAAPSVVRIPIVTRNLSILQKVHTGHGAQQASRSVGTGFFAGVKRPGRELNYSAPT
jgi:hypothetical protein